MAVEEIRKIDRRKVLVLRCDNSVCAKVFETKYTKQRMDKPRHYCSCLCLGSNKKKKQDRQGNIFCVGCSQFLPRGSFYKDKRATTGVRTSCIECETKDQDVRLDQNRVKPPKVRTCKKCKVEKPIEEFPKDKRSLSGYRHGCKECKPNRSEYFANKYRNDVRYRILSIQRSRIRSALCGTTKSETTQNLLGCSVEEFKQHLEAQFDIGMSWENYGLSGWHIDHIRPCCTFDLTDPEQQKECFHYLNTQPLWAEDNLKKRESDAKTVYNTQRN